MCALSYLLITHIDSRPCRPLLILQSTRRLAIVGVQVYLTTLEAVKAVVSTSCNSRGVGPAETAAIASSVGGGVASLTTQAIIVPVDVVGSRLDPPGLHQT